MTDPRTEIVTFGCRANQYESAMMARLLDEAPVRAEGANVFVLNACTVTGLAERKARQTAHRLRREHPGSAIVVVGCLADAVAKGLTSFDDADLLAGNAWKPRIAEVVEQARTGVRGALPPAEPGPLSDERSRGPEERVRAHLKIQDGCSRACTYCRATQVRGEPRSKPIGAAVDEAADLVGRGFPEIVLTGIDLAQYAPPGGSLAEVVERLLSIDGLFRLRIASIGPSGLTPALIDVFASDDRACPHFHVPLQSGDDRLLERMARGYSVADYRARVDAVRARIPTATFGTDVIVGFPGEDGDAFSNTCAVVERIGFTNLHTFRFSPRPGTVAANLSDPVPERIARQRADTLARRWHRSLAPRLDKRIGTTQHVLVEERRENEWRGYTSDYLYVRFTSDGALPVGCILPVRIVAARDEHLEGQLDD